MELECVRPGLRVRTTSRLLETTNILLNRRVLNRRQAGAEGEVIKFVDGHGGDIWYVRHSDRDRTVAPYSYRELEPIK